MTFFRAGTIYAAANIASAGVPFLLLPLLTRVLDATEYGHVIAFTLMVTLFTPFAGLSVHSAVGVAWFNRPRDELRAFNGAALIVAIASGVIWAPVMIAVVAVFPAFFANLHSAWGAVAVVTASANVVILCRLVLWQSQQRPWHNAAFQFTSSFLNVGLSLVAVLLLGWDGSGRIAGIAFSAVLMACVSIGLFLFSQEAILSLRRGHIRALVSYGLPLIPHVFAGVLLATADRWIVSAQLGSDVLGVYGAGAQLGTVMSILADAFMKAYNPWLYARLASKDDDDKYSIIGAIYLAVPAFMWSALVLGLGLFWASSFLLGAQYRSATALLPWFVLGGAFTGIYLCVATLFFFAGRTLLLAMATTTSALIGTFLIWMLIVLFGVEGAAMGYAATQCLLAVIVAGVASHSFDLPWHEVRRPLSIWWSQTTRANVRELYSRQTVVHTAVSPTTEL